jgi:serine/threonine-protein kinase
MGIPHLIANRFRVEREIGRGGMGTVYRALHLGLERPVAVKVLKPEFAADPEVADRFMREARTMARLRHRGAAMIFDAGRLPDGRPYIVMEYVEGATLADTLTKEGRLAPARAVEIACAICDVLAEAHALGIVHRDLKPSNIMLTADGGVCLLDFGIAKVLANSNDVTRTHATTESGLIIGTPRYMSPEQCLGQPVGPASDLYSVGVLLYEMLAGRPPFVDQLQSVVLVKQATALAPPLVAHCQDTPRRLALAVHTLLAKNPNDRPRTAAAARRLLAQSLNAQTQELPAPPPFADTVATVNRRAARAPRLLAAAMLLAALGGGWLVWAYTGQFAPAAGMRAAAMSTDEEPPPSRPRAVRNADVPGRAKPSFAAAAPAADTPALSDAAARQLALAAARGGTVTEARALETNRGPAVVALRDERAEGTTHLFLLEMRNASSGFRVTGRAPLDVEDFRGAHWTTELVDADGDGYEEVLCTGTDARNDPFSRRLVLYVPRARETYSLRAGADGRESGAVRVKWSANAGSPRAKPYRAAMRERALADLPRVKS